MAQSADQNTKKTDEQTTSEDQDTAKKRTPSDELPPELKKTVLREYFESAIVTVIMALFSMTFILQFVRVPTGSMLNTILIGDYLVVNKFVFGLDGLKIDSYSPHRPIKRGDIIVFKYPEDPNTNFVKRVIGLPGETIEVKGTKVFINGQELPEQHIIATEGTDSSAPLIVNQVKDAPQGATYKVYYSSENGEKYDETRFKALGEKYAIDAPFVIPPGQYFAMGDNRENSKDSRYWGTVPRENIVGQAMVVFWSLDLTRDPDKKSDLPFLDILTKSRWSRIGTRIK